MQAFYAEFGELMMRQPVIGLDFQSYLPIAIVPYMLLLAFNVFNRSAAPCPCLLHLALPVPQPLPFHLPLLLTRPAPALLARAREWDNLGWFRRL